jgi:hypothetical protein
MDNRATHHRGRLVRGQIRVEDLEERKQGAPDHDLGDASAQVALRTKGESEKQIGREKRYDGRTARRASDIITPARV